MGFFFFPIFFKYFSVIEYFFTSQLCLNYFRLPLFSPSLLFNIHFFFVSVIVAFSCFKIDVSLLCHIICVLLVKKNVVHLLIFIDGLLLIKIEDFFIDCCLLFLLWCIIKFIIVGYFVMVVYYDFSLLFLYLLMVVYYLYVLYLFICLFMIVYDKQ